jgi:hypothetical protein
MKLTKFIQQQNSIIFYPFSGTDFTFIKESQKESQEKNILRGALYLFCTIATREEHDNLAEQQQCGLFDEVVFEENKMGLAGLKLNEKLKLEAPFDSTYYRFTNEVQLIIVKTNVFSLIEYFKKQAVSFSNFNLVVKGGGTEMPVLKILDIIHPKNDLTKFKFIITDSYWKSRVKKHFDGLDCYKIMNHYSKKYGLFIFHISESSPRIIGIFNSRWKF